MCINKDYNDMRDNKESSFPADIVNTNKYTGVCYERSSNECQRTCRLAG
jgi:hypothetical protein